MSNTRDGNNDDDDEWEDYDLSALEQDHQAMEMMREADADRVTRKGRRLQMSDGNSAPSSNATRSTQVPGAFHDPHRPSGYTDVERMAQQRRLQQIQERRMRDQEAAATVVTASHVVQSPSEPPSHQGSMPSPIQSFVPGQVVEESPHEPSPVSPEDGMTGRSAMSRERRKTWIYTANIFIVFVVALVLVIVLPIELQKGSPSGPPLTRPPTPVSPPSPQRTRPPTPTFPPSLSPRGAPFVPSGPEIMGANEFAELGSDVTFVGDRWFAYGSQGHGVNRSGLVRVVDLYNGTQIGQDIEGNTTEGFTEVGWALASAEGGWLAVAGRHTVHVLLYNETTALWEQYGRILSSTDIKASSFLSTWYVQWISINPFLPDNSTISLVVTTYHDRYVAYDSFVNTFVIDIDHPFPDWRRLGETLIFRGERVYPSLVAGPRLLVWPYGGRRSVRIFAMDRLGWGLPLVNEELGVVKVDAVAVVPHSNGSSTIAYLDKNFIRVVEIDTNANVTDKGLPIGSVGTFRDRLALYGDWLVHATRTVVRVFHYDDSNEWTRQGEDIDVESGGFYVAPALGGDPESPTLAVGLPGKGMSRYVSVYLDSTNLTSFTNQTNLFTNETGHVFENLTLSGYEGAVQLYNREM